LSGSVIRFVLGGRGSPGTAGLSIVLGFIGVKLVLHALHENTLPFINGGEHLSVPLISTGLSLLVILGVLVLTAVASLLKTRNMAGKT
jgi:tellurite resistance protein TerC